MIYHLLKRVYGNGATSGFNGCLKRPRPDSPATICLEPGRTNFNRILLYVRQRGCPHKPKYPKVGLDQLYGMTNEAMRESWGTV